MEAFIWSTTLLSFLLAFTEQDEDNWQNSHKSSFSGIDPSCSFPENVALITLQVGEDKELSSMASVELKRLFSTKKIGKVTKTSLTANQERSEMQKKRLLWKSQGASEQKVVRGGPIDPAKLVVQLVPMEIRTLLIEFNVVSHV